MNPVIVTIIVAVLGFFATWTATVWLSSLWLNRQFNVVSEKVIEVKEQLNQKLEDTKDSIDDKLIYHERLDDERFNQLQLAIMKIEMREENQGKIVGPHQI